MSDEERSPENLKRSRAGNDYDSDRDDDRQQRGSKRRNYNDRTELRLLIQSKDAGSIIGKGGDNIKRLREEFKVGVTVSDSRAPERTVTISGELESISRVIDEIVKGFDDRFKTGRREDESELKMMVHQSQAGCVIGKAGAKLKEFRQDFAIDIKVYPQCCPRSTDRIVQVTGKVPNVVKCICSILDMLKTWPPKGMSNQYDPANNYDEVTVRDYGGYFDDGRSGRGRDRDRLGAGGSGLRNRGLGSGSRDRGGMAGGAGGGSSSRTTQQVSIPGDLAGVIIGKGGQNIKRIRLESGAEIELSDASDDGSDRIITLTGTPGQIQNAQYLLQMSVKQHLSRN